LQLERELQRSDEMLCFYILFSMKMKCLNLHVEIVEKIPRQDFVKFLIFYDFMMHLRLLSEYSHILFYCILNLTEIAENFSERDSLKFTLTT
jgi:hypothetical protein